MALKLVTNLAYTVFLTIALFTTLFSLLKNQQEQFLDYPSILSTSAFKLTESGNLY